jgi:hypothetical protein
MGAASEPKVYVPRVGTVPDRIMTALRAASPYAVPREALSEAARTSTFAVYLCDMVKKGHIARSPLGLHLPGVKPLPPKPRPVVKPAAPVQVAAAKPAPVSVVPIEEPSVPLAPPAPEHLRRLIAALVRRAHAFRLAGARSEAATLMRQAAGAHGLDAWPQIRADLLALADLFAAHGTTYPELDLRRVA